MTQASKDKEREQRRLKSRRDTAYTGGKDMNGTKTNMAYERFSGQVQLNSSRHVNVQFEELKQS